jgi:Ser/Thr protein kinase RdoA (MazF antagonist)
MKPFYELTNRGRALRLRRMALVALERYDLAVERVRLIDNDLNGIFRVDTAGGRKYVLRVCLPEPGGHSLEEIRSEAMWLAALRRDTGLGVPRPLAARDGAFVTTVEVDGVPEPRHCAVFSWVPGPDLADRLTLENVSRQGELLAELHRQAGTFAPPDGFWLRRKDKVFSFGETVVLFDESHRHLFPPARRRVYEEAVARAQEAIDALYARGGGPCVIHNDLHQWNVKVSRGRLYALDFEDLMWGYPAQEVAVSLYYLVGYEEYPALREAFERGYTSLRPWPEQAPGEIDAFIASRGLMLVNYIVQDPNPDYQPMAPEFVERVEGRLRMLLDL